MAAIKRLENQLALGRSVPFCASIEESFLNELRCHPCPAPLDAPGDGVLPRERERCKCPYDVERRVRIAGTLVFGNRADTRPPRVEQFARMRR